MSADPRRVQLEPAWLLHHRPLRDTSLLLDVLTARHGRLVLVARGVRSARSRLKGVLRPFLPLRLSWVTRGDLGTLTGAELDGRPLHLSGDALLSGYYVNELLLGFLHRHDPQPEVFDAYRHTVTALAAGATPAAVLRSFELELLRLQGYAVLLRHEAGEPMGEHGAGLVTDASYEYRVEQGPVRVTRSEGEQVYTGRELAGIEARRFDEPDILRAATRLLRMLITHHLGGRELKCRKVLVDLRRGRAKMRGHAGPGDTQETGI